jgi:peptide/nickel transport system permease protein
MDKTMNTIGNEDTLVEVKHPLAEAFRVFYGNKAAVGGVVLFAFILLVAAIGPALYPVNPFEVVASPMTPPGDKLCLFGTDYLGRDILAGIIHGIRATLAVGVAAAGCTLLFGITFGALAGFYRGWVETLLMRITELFQVFPPLLLAMVIVALFSPALITVVIAIGISTWPDVARLTRGEFLKAREQNYVKAARAMAASNGYLIFRVILPNCLPPLIAISTLRVGAAILFESMLSFMGFSDPNIMTWGLMIGSNRDFIFAAWWAVTLPGAAIFLTILSISLIGDGLNDAFNPKLRER